MPTSPDNSQGFNRCADELIQIRAEVSRGFEEIRHTLEEVNGQLRDGAVQIAVSTQRLDSLEARQRRDQSPPRGTPAIQGPNWILQAAVVAGVTVIASSFTGFILLNWGKHVAQAGLSP